MKVRVYYNLHKKCWSVVDVATGKVCLHAERVQVRDARFVVRPAGREKVRREQKKTVHAFVVGELCEVDGKLDPSCTQRVTYNPYLHDQFVEYYGHRPVERADNVFLDGRMVFAENVG